MDELDTPAWQVSFGRVLRLRYVLLAIATGAAAVLAPGRGDWNTFVDAGKAMFGHDGWRFYATHHDIQTGPLALLIARLAAFTPRDGYVVCVLATAVLGLVAVRVIDRERSPWRDEVRTSVAVLLGGLVLMSTWANLGGYGHLDDAIVLVVAVFAMRFALQGRPMAAAVIVGLALGVKPWAVMFLPFALVPSATAPNARVWQRGRPLAVALAIGALVWVPFYLGSSRELDSTRPTVVVARDSVLHLLGITDQNLPSWIRLAQLAAGGLAGMYAVKRRRFAGVILCVVAVRLALDPATWSYYTPGLVLGAFAWDVCWSRRMWPLATFAAAVLVAPGWMIPGEDTRAVMRLVACGLSLALVIGGAVSARSPSADQMSPTSDPSAVG